MRADQSRFVSSLVVSGCFLASGCAADSSHPVVEPNTAPQVDESLAPNQAAYEFVGRWNSETQKLTIEPLRTTIGVGLKGFGQINNGNVGYGTGVNVIGPNSSYPGGSGGCPSNTACAMVSATNLSSLTMETLYTEVTSITSGFSIANSDTAATGYSPPLNTSIGVWNYGTLAAGATGTKDWRFNLGSGNFSFAIRALATFTRTAYTHTADVSATFVDACTMSSHSEITGATSVQLPFPTSIYGVTNTSIFVGIDGIMGVGAVGSTTTNAGGFTGTQAWNNSIAPFWENLSLGTTSKVCYATSGSSESRTFYVTWENVVEGGTSTDLVNVTVALAEKSDNFVFYYGDLCKTDKCHGWGASIGVRGSSSSQYDAFADDPKTAVVNSNTKITFTASPTDPAAK